MANLLRFAQSKKKISETTFQSTVAQYPVKVLKVIITDYFSLLDLQKIFSNYIYKLLNQNDKFKKIRKIVFITFLFCPFNFFQL